MLEDLSAIQSRIADIEQRLASLNAPPPQQADAPAFGQTLRRAQEAALPSLNETRVPLSSVYVTPAALGPLPPGGAAPLPVTPSEIVPLPRASAEKLDPLIQNYAAKNGLPPALVKAVIQTESGGNPRAVSRAGAMGLMQLMPANVREAGVHDPFDPEQNIAAGTQQLAHLMAQYGGDLDLTLAGYNAGPGNVKKYGGVPPFTETQNYIRRVRAAMGSLEKG